jgi:flagellar biosynthesis/type III secretory pathway protein FliH
MGMTIDEIRQLLNKADLMLRPNILFVNPSDAKIIRDAIPNIDSKIILTETDYIERGKCYLMNRKSLI